MRGLLIRKPFLDKILSGKKRWEIRGSPAQLGPIALIESGSGSVVGQCELVEVMGPLTLQQLKANARKIGCSPSELTSQPYRRTYAWALKDAERLPKPVPYSHPYGAVVWVKLAPSVARKVHQR